MFISPFGTGFRPLGLVGGAAFRFHQSSTQLGAHNWPDILWVTVFVLFFLFFFPVVLNLSEPSGKSPPHPRRQWIPCRGWMDQRSKVVHWKKACSWKWNWHDLLSGQTGGCMGKGISPSAQTSGDLMVFSHFSAAGNGVHCWGLLGTPFLNSWLLV